MNGLILSVVGARPQFIKAAVVSRGLKATGIEEAIVHTGQHYDDVLSGRLLRELGINNIISNLDCRSGTHAVQTAQMMVGLESVMIQHADRVRAVLVYGDTNSSIAAALAASKLQLPVIHVESGLRSFNRGMPEEVNRVVVDHLSDLLFCSSQTAVDQLAKEGIDKPVIDVGDVMLDAFEHFMPIALDTVQHHDLESTDFSIVTIHRPSNTDDPSRLSTILKRFGEVETTLVWPVHPRMGDKLKAHRVPDNVKLIPPLSYFEMLVALSRCGFVVTDSGGLQKEAYWAQKQCITVREETEWTETLSFGWNRLWNPSARTLNEMVDRKPERSWTKLYGDGQSCRHIASEILNRFGAPN